MPLLTCIDLFSGCGGFTLGMMRADFQVLAAVDVDSVAISSLRVNLVEKRPPGLIPVSNALVRDLTTFRPSQLAELIGTGSVDVIVGGPPCQGFSAARQVDGANHGARLKDDPRRRLYKEFLRHGEMAIDRRSKPSFVLRGRRLTFGLMVQPEACAVSWSAPAGCRAAPASSRAS